MSKYYEWDKFENIYFEDSFVLGIEESEIAVSFIVDAVLTEKHPMYSPPIQDEQYCYKRARLTFSDLKNVRWFQRNSDSFIDADGSEDFGNIDSFELLSEGYYLQGDWGKVIICSETPNLEWLE